MLKLIAVALAPVFILLVFFYIKDKYDREPLRLLLRAVIYGGIAAVIACLIECSIIHFIKESSIKGFFPILLYNLLAIALVEEGAKFWFLIRKFYPHPEFNEVYDGIIYGAFISLGFASIENLGYVLDLGMGVGIGRAFTAVPGHAIYGALAGYYVGLAKFTPNSVKRKFLILSGFLYAVLLHGFYDASIGWDIGVFTVFILFGILMFGTYMVLKNIKKAKSQI